MTPDAIRTGISVVVAAVVFWVGNAAMGEKQFKGTEVYPWKLKGELVFTVLPGTNRLKTCDEIRNEKSALKIDALEKRLSLLDAQEYVFIMDGKRVTGCAIAALPAAMKKRLSKFAESKKLQLTF